MRSMRGAAAALLASTLALSACTGTPELEVTTATPQSEESPTSAPTPTPTPTPVVEAERGTRANPLAVGESRQIAEKSMWTVGATGATEVREGFLVLPVRLQMDWETSRANTAESGQDPTLVDNEGVDPSGAIFISFVSASGRSFTTFDQYEADVPDPELWQVGTLFPPAEFVDVFHVVSVPPEEVAGGVWKVSNIGGESVYLAP
ncbi:hypothetical protein ACO03V_14455 [Microbacterium sp. HMH0099]|uniref:hypothetical protein n=1 Tax=Microbacterium sp. HMH0099 TaxID=3414026 RepID=UPI003BF70739